MEQPDFFGAFSSIAYERFKDLCGPDSIVFHNPDLVISDPSIAAKHLAVRFEILAERELGAAVFANIIFLGVLSNRFPQISSENFIKALRDRLPPTSHERNLRAFELGRAFLVENAA